MHIIHIPRDLWSRGHESVLFNPKTCQLCVVGHLLAARGFPLRTLRMEPDPEEALDNDFASEVFKRNIDLAYELSWNDEEITLTQEQVGTLVGWGLLGPDLSREYNLEPAKEGYTTFKSTIIEMCMSTNDRSELNDTTREGILVYLFRLLGYDLVFEDDSLELNTVRKEIAKEIAELPAGSLIQEEGL